jgi:hypothetical protein
VRRKRQQLAGRITDRKEKGEEKNGNVSTREWFKAIGLPLKRSELNRID